MDENSENQKYCLKWNNFQSNFMSEFEALKDDEDFVDVTLSCCGQSIKAHKVVLSTCSPYLKNIFKQHPCKHAVIILDNLSFKNLEAVIQFIYTGQVYLEQSELPSFLKAAETLQIRGLSDSSTSQNLVDTNFPQSHSAEDTLKSGKRKTDSEFEINNIPNKKNHNKNSNSSNVDVDENKEEEKDWSSQNPILKFEGNIENPKISLIPPDYAMESNEKILRMQPDEELSSGEQKKPHWLDPRSCPMCNRVYSNLSNLRQHMKLIHNPTLVTCKLCYKTFKTDLYLRRHLIGFHEINSNDNSLVSIEKVKTSQQSETFPWIQTVKTEQPDAFSEIFGGGGGGGGGGCGEIYRVPE